MSTWRRGPAHSVPAVPGLQRLGEVPPARPARALHSTRSSLLPGSRAHPPKTPRRWSWPLGDTDRDKSTEVFSQRASGGQGSSFSSSCALLATRRRCVIEEVHLERRRFPLFLVFTFFSSSGAGRTRHLRPTVRSRAVHTVEKRSSRGFMLPFPRIRTPKPRGAHFKIIHCSNRGVS